MKGKTISTRWKEWAEKEPGYSYTALLCMALGFLGLIVHLAVLSGIWRTVGLTIMIGGGVACEGILVYRRQWWWAGYWGLCVLIGVGVTEILSVVFS
jgi:hypothetical protein